MSIVGEQSAPDAAEAAIEARGDRPIQLEPGRAWIVRTGRIDVFATEVEEDGAPGRRTHLFRVEAGGALLGTAPTRGMVMLGVGAPGTTLAGVELEGEGSPVGPAARRLVEGWVKGVYEGLELEGRVPRHHTLEPGCEWEAEPGSCVRPSVPVGWLEVVEGSAELLGNGAGPLPAGTIVPVSLDAWVKASEPCRFRLHTTQGQLDGGGTGRALDRLNGAALALVAERVRADEAAERERALKRARASESAMCEVVSQLAETVQTKVPQHARVRNRPRGEDESETASLFPAFRLVASARGIELTQRRHEEEEQEVSSKDPILALARSYRVRTRRVAMREGWWRSDGEPLLARLADRPRAVALLPNAGGYDLVDPYERTQVRVDEEVAETLGPFAYTLYRPFRAEALRAMDLLRFGLHGCRRDLGMVAATGVVAAILGLVTPLAVGVLYSTIIPGAQRGQLVLLTVLLIVCAVAVAVFEAVRGYALLRIDSRAGPTLQAAVWDRLLSLPLPFFRDYTAGDLAMRAMGIEEIRTIASGTLLTVLLKGIFSLANFVLLFSYDLRLALIAAGLVLLAVAVSFGLSYLQIRRQRVILPLRSRTAGVVLQLITGMAKLKATACESYGFALWARLFTEQRKHQFVARNIRNMQTVFSAAYPVLATLVLFHAVAGASAAEAAVGAAGAPGAAPAATMMPTGEFLAFITAFNLALSAMLTSSSALVGALAVVPLYEQLKPILEAAPEVHTGKRDPGELSGAVELQHVTFRYRPDGPAALRDLSIRARPGEFVALVGPSGSGKSTILRLLLGFELPEAGSVSYDEQDLSGLDPETVRRQIGVVTQSGRLMSGDIYTNIVGSSNATLDEAWEAARMAGLEDDIKQMPMGMHTVISDGGGTFSGGQRQRLMIARALLRRPRMIFFDEATSALDNRTQDIVSRSLERLKATRIVVAHRLSTIQKADRIYVIQGGSVVEAGTFDDLLARGGVFAELAARQLA